MNLTKVIVPMSDTCSHFAFAETTEQGVRIILDRAKKHLFNGKSEKDAEFFAHLSRQCEKLLQQSRE